ncbi:uncharacterized protein LOC133728181 isoform X1 [Rosa rugosa]|uniref:uncharacterized protein LOC133728181 isoform X1 n=1 Tax=Rosa rugosa TaxID=74645 RepID=UPI002B405B8B|nr:uncharacterized protein LOC133728181 isoform X1 [Rosa rugosa]XP_062011576.1 uncharacterized protein LOC133728181 isoform X1 [Rosa rugosa]
MSDQGEKTCPLCAEEMDLTDQQLKPCKCGYEICVWCWHHIMDMAEKDDTEGRCPACRTPYDKEKIVGAAKCERLVAEINTERKKSQKTKVKPTTEGRKQLSSVRVIQRNLVYIVGLPLNLADEDQLLQRKEYFAQYGKVLKVSMSRTAAGVIQQFPNNTCSVYITYSKEEEAVRCIQNVHGFLLDGRSLRACFGTTKYCHAWLRNVPCTNPDCLYLHEVGCHEDSFTKDEIISAYTRSRVQQITGTLNPMQRRSGSVLPPPLDDYCNSSSASTAGPVVKNGSSNTGTLIKGSPPNGSSGRSIALPAAASWGTRGSNSQPPAMQIIYSNGHTKQKPDTVSCTVPFSSAAVSTGQASIVHSDAGKRSTLNEDSQTMQAKGELESLKIVKQHISVDSQIALLDNPAAPDEASASVNVSSQLSCPPASKDNNRGSSMQPTNTATNHNRQPFSSCHESESIVSNEEAAQSLCSDISLLSIDRNSMLDHSGVVRPNNSASDNSYIKSPRDQGLQQYCAEQPRESPITTERAVTREQSNWLSESQPLPSISSEVEEDVLSFDNQRLKDPEVSRAPYLSSLPNAVHVPNHSRSPLLPSEGYGAVYSSADRLFVDNKIRDSSLLSSTNIPVQSNGYHENFVSSSSGLERPLEHSFLNRNESLGKHGRRFLGDANPDFSNAVDKGESSIISNILSMDFDTWDDPITSPQNFSKFLGESDRRSGAQKVSSSWKVPNNNQSRFSFARQEDSRNQAFDLQSSQNVIGRLSQNQAQNQGFHHGYSENRDLCLDNFGIGNGFPSSTFEDSENHANNLLAFSSNKLSAVSRAQTSAPPGFSVPSRAPPPGFTSQERVEHDFDSLSGNLLHDNSSLLRNAYQPQPTGNIGSSVDIEFMDPAILAVGKGRLQGGLNNPGVDMRSNFPSQLSAFENDARLQLLMQRSFSQQQNLRYPDFGDGYSHVNDNYGMSSRLLDQSQASNMSPFAQLSLQQSRNNRSMSNGHWDGWNEVQGGNTMGMAERLRNERVNERLGYNKFYSGYEESKFRMPSSGDLYNRTFGM